MKQLKQAFSLVELIIAISTIIIISVIAVTSMEGSKDKSNNSKILSDLDTLNNAFKSYSEETKILPDPKGNLQYYGEDTGYRHDYETAFGVSGYVTNEVLPAKYMNNLPLDPKTGQYYGYAKTKNTLHFEVAGVLFENNNPKAKISGNWTGEFGPYNLVKEYAGPNFVYDNGTDFFPYNPYEKMLLAKISSYTGGILKINDTIFSDKEVLDYNLGEGDTIEISTGGTVNLYFSDGSNSVLGDNTSDSKITLQNMKFVEDNNLYTSIKLALNIGSLWTKASKMSDKSEFEVYTADALAAVRGTIFGLRQGTNNSDIVVQEGKVEANKIISGTEYILTGSSLSGVVSLEVSKTYIDVPSGSGSKGVSINVSTNYSSTGAIGKLTEEGSGIVIENIPELNQNQQIELQNINQLNASAFKINIVLQKSFKNAQYIKLINKNSVTYSLKNTWINNTGSTLLLSGGTIFSGSTLGGIIINSPEIKLSFCSIKNSKERCSKELPLIIKDNVSYDIDTQTVSSCETDIDDIYQELFKRNISRVGCKELTEINNWSNKTKEQKKLYILNHMSGQNCIDYQKVNGVIEGSGFLNCKATKVKIGGEKIDALGGALGYNLIAYASYNNNLELTKLNNSLVSKYDYELGDCHETFESGTGVFKNSPLCEIDLNTAGLGSLGFNIQDGFGGYSIYKWGDYGQGVMIDNNSNDDKLQYSNVDTDLGLTSTGNFMLEFSLRGAALKRTSSNFYIFHLGDFHLRTNSTNIMLNSTPVIGISEYAQKLENNKFYRLVAKYDKGITSLYLFDENKLIFKKENIRTFNTLGTLLYIGSDNTPTQQWNDIIDSVKIYKRPSISLASFKAMVGDVSISEKSITNSFSTVNIEN